MNNTAIVSPNRRSFVAMIGSIGVVSILSSCGKTKEDTTSTPQPKASNPAPSDNGGNDAYIPQPVDKIDYSQNEEFGIVLGDGIFNDEHGEYRQLTVSENSSLMKYDKSLAEESVFYAFTEEEVKSAQQFISPFVVEQADSTLLWDNSSETKNEWLEKHIDKFSEAARDDLVKEVQEPTNDWYSIINGNANNWKSNIAPIYVENQPRIAFTDIKLDSITAFLDETENNEERLRFDYTWTAMEDAYDDEENGVLVIRAERTFALKRDGKGGWLINGWVGKFVYETVSGEKFDPTKKYAQDPFPELE